MQSNRSSWSLGAKLDEKLDEENFPSGAASSRSHRDAGDVEKGPELGQPPSTPIQTHDDAFLVKWEENDPANPRNWKSSYKAFLTFQLGMLALCGSFGSSVIAPAEGVIAQEFEVSREVTVLCIALYVLGQYYALRMVKVSLSLTTVGFAFGPCLWAPISEVYGRKVSILPAVFVLALFSIGSATSHSAASLFVTRFFAGVFGSAPISNVSAALGDLYEPAARGIAVTFYAVCVCGGPTLGPVTGAALTVTKGWRWTEYIEAIWVAANFFVALVTMPEVFHAVLLKRKAVRLRKETGDSRYWHPHENEKIRLSNIVTKYLIRPLRMLITEPMITCIALYASFVYGLLYMTLEIFPIVYLEERQWQLVVSTLPFLGIFVGVIAAMGLNIANQPYYIRAVAANKGRAVPEARLPPMFLGGWLFVIGLFW
jgi:MFS family permease